MTGQSTVGIAGFGMENFGQARLGDVRRTRRLVLTVDRIAAHPGGTLPDKLKEPRELEGLYRLCAEDAVTHDAVLATHRALTRRRMREADAPVLVLHDDTELDYTGLKSIADLGQIGKGNRRGYVCHNSLAVGADGEVIGLAAQILHTRAEAPKRESRAARAARADRESRLWQKGCEAVGLAPPGKLWVNVTDRGSDLFEYLWFQHHRGTLAASAAAAAAAPERLPAAPPRTAAPAAAAPGAGPPGGSYVVRAKNDRVVEVEEGGRIRRVKLFAHARALPTLGSKTVEVPPRPGQSARSAEVRVAAGRVRLTAPRRKRGQHGDEPLEAWVVHVCETHPPAGQKAVEWVLVTNVPAEGRAAAFERVVWYERRWVIEEFHKGQKTGCGIEDLQFTAKARLEPVIALLSVVAVLLLRLRDAGRRPEARERPAEELVPRPYVDLLAAWRHQGRRPAMTVWDFTLALGRLGGHQNRKADGAPGWLTLWRGWTKLHHMLEGVAALRAMRSG